MTGIPLGEHTVFLSDLPAGRGQCRFACAIIVVSTVIFLVLAPFAKIALAPMPSFIAIYQSALFVNDLITAVFLLGQCQFLRSNTLYWLAGGYLFTALMTGVHALTFPGLFTATGLLAAGTQTTAWLYVFWHSGFPCLVIVYAMYRTPAAPFVSGGRVIGHGAGLVIAAVCGLALVATLGQSFLPPLMRGNQYTPAAFGVVSSVWLLSLLAVLILSRRTPYTVLDLWLIVTMCAWLFDIALSAMLNGGRYDLGFYAGRIYGLAAASLVLIVLLVENSRLYVQLIKLRESDRQKAVELHLLSTIDPLTGISNRRAFEEAIDQEWRRMMRHGTTLSLLMIDVDYFKRFNDAYGHVAGDHCLRTVAQTLAGRARRAGEMAARYGGEEFAVLLPHTDIGDATTLADRLCRAVRERDIPHQGSEVATCVTISVGVGSVGDLPRSATAMSRDTAKPHHMAADAGSAGATTLIRIADGALYRAKAGGRNRAVAASDDGIAEAAAA